MGLQSAKIVLEELQSGGRLRGVICSQRCEQMMIGFLVAFQQALHQIQIGSSLIAPLAKQRVPFRALHQGLGVQVLELLLVQLL